MKFGNTAACKVQRWALLVAGLLLVCKIVESIPAEDYMSALVAGGILCLCAYGIYENPRGELTQEGIFVRHFFIRRFYRWEDLKQAGIMCRQGCNSYYEIILVKPKGDFRNPESFSCWLRNQFYLINIPYDEVLLHLIRDRYGALDFDQRG
jgi:hypothetical protein